MGGFVCLCKTLRKKLGGKKVEKIASQPVIVSCNCGWEIEAGYTIAYGLSILEAKRLFLLALGIFAEWNLVRFAGGFIPLVLTGFSASFGAPASLAIVFAIQKRRQRPSSSPLKNLFKLLSGLIIICVIFNAITTASITAYLNTRPESIARIFNTSMTLYSEETWHKVIVDEFQFNFQCCGHTGCNDWLAFDWQKVDYASRDEMYNQQTISDEDYRPMAVPFSCCSTRSMTPCFNTDITMDRVNSLNQNGCADVLSRVVSSGAVVAYCVSTFIILAQIILAFIVVKIANRPPLPSGCRPSARQLLESCSTSCASASSSDCSTRSKNREGGSRTSGTEISSPSSSSPPPVSNSKNTSSKSRNTARIRPSLHTEHRVPEKRYCCQKRTEVRPD